MNSYRFRDVQSRVISESLAQFRHFEEGPQDAIKSPLLNLPTCFPAAQSMNADANLVGESLLCQSQRKSLLPDLRRR